MISKEEFIKACDSIIPKEEIEKHHLCKVKMWTTLLITLLIEATIVAFISTFWVYIWFVGVFLAIISIAIIVGTTRYSWKDFKAKYSNQALDCLFKGYKFSHELNKCISPTIFKSSGFGGDYDSYSGEDLLSVDIPNDDGTPSGVNLNICDLHVTKEEKRTVVVKNSDGSYSTETETYTVVIYDGVFGYVFFPFEFKCDLSLNFKYIGQQKIKLEDVNFNKKFKTYTDDQLEALVILTPKLMEKLIRFSNRVKNFKITLTRKGAIYFGMSRNLFKLNSFFKKPTGKVFERYYEDVADILAMVDEIKNNNKVFKM